MKKVYIYYLTIPEKPYGKFTAKKLSAFNVVTLLLRQDYYYKKSGIIIELNNVERYLYAYTTNKEHAKDFEYMHEMTLFTKIVKKMDKEELKEFTEEMEHAELDYRSMDDGSTMLITKLENHVLETSFDDVEIYLSEFARLGYEAFQDEYIQALDILLYTLYYQMNGQEAEFYSYNYSYGLTPEGVHGNQVYATLNCVNMYIEIFALILK